MPYRNTATGKLEPLPWRIVMPDGSTRTDPDQWWQDEEARAASGFIESEVTPDDLIPEPPATPATVSARQIRLWLIRNGVSLAQVDAAIAAIPDQQQREECRVEWEFAPYVERSHAMLLPLAAALGLTSEQVDDAFREAATL